MLAARGSSSSPIFTTGPTMTNDQSGRTSATWREQVDVEPLVDHAVEAEARTLELGLVGGLRQFARALAKWATVDRRREAVDVAVAVLLRLVEARAAGEDEVGAVDQLLLEVEQALPARSGTSKARPCSRRRRTLGLEMPREGQHHRRVVPGDQRAGRAPTIARRADGAERFLAPLVGQAFAEDAA